VGNIAIGGSNAVSVQSMCNTKTTDIQATIRQIHELEEAGCDIVRVAVPDMGSGLGRIPRGQQRQSHGRVRGGTADGGGGTFIRAEEWLEQVGVKTLFNEPGSGLHLHQYLGSEKGSLFYHPKKEKHLSELCLHYIAGILHHSRALCALTNPSTNSYKRLIPGFEAPTYTDFAVGNRKTAIRLPKYLKNKKMMEIEYRIPDATANPYLALSAILLAGIDGVKNRFKVDKREKLPTNVYEAINALKQDHEFLFQGGVFSEDLIDSWIEVKTKQFEEVHIRPHPHEFTLYFGT